MIRRGGWVKPGVAQRAADALAGLLERGVRQADDREARQPGRDVHLDADEPAVEAVERCGRDDGQHDRAALRAGRSPRLTAINRRLTHAGFTAARGSRRLRALSGAGYAARRGRRHRLVDGPGELEQRPPSAESAFVNMNGAPELSALIAPRYSLTIWCSIVRLSAPSAFLTLIPVKAFERLRTSWTLPAG